MTRDRFNVETREATSELDVEDIYLYTWYMEFTWNPEKRVANLKKHGLDFADAELVFSGYTMTRPDRRFAYGEARFSTMGLLGDVVVNIIHTESEEEIRIISMRKAERHEQERFFECL